MVCGSTRRVRASKKTKGGPEKEENEAFACSGGGRSGYLQEH
jgi:hypothetical protein